LATRFNRDVRQDLSSFPLNSPEITFEQIQQLAQTNCATIVEYFVVAQEEAEAKIYIWAVQPSGSTLFKTVELNSGSQQQNSFLSNLVIKARESFGVKHSQTIGNNLERSLAKTKDSFSLGSSRELEQSQTLLAELYQLLIEPIESCLNTSSANKVILIPHGTLFLIPFATLLNPQTNQYLVEQYSIILAPSLQTLNLTQQNFVSAGEAQNVLVVGNPQMPSFGEPPQPLPQLPYAETAARTISNLFKTKPLVGKQVTKQEIITQLPHAKIIHFGTHGEFNDSQPLESGIALAPEGDEGGFLTVGDILAQFAPPQTLSLNAELVVLSACSTGLGKITGDGVLGLARGLMAAGVKAVLVSLWEVQDFPTACLMVQFYKYLQVGNTPHEALKQAQVWLKGITNDELREWMRREKLPLKSMEKQNLMNWLRQEQQQGNSYPFRHPYYWGAFYLIGS
jgi:CHAT domain-containing protein